MMMTTLSWEHISAIRFASYNAAVARVHLQMWQAMQTCTGLRFHLLGHYPKPIEFFKLHFEEAMPSAKNE